MAISLSVSHIPYLSDKFCFFAFEKSLLATTLLNCYVPFPSFFFFSSSPFASTFDNFFDGVFIQ